MTTTPFTVDIFFIGILGVVTDQATPPGKVALLVPSTDLDVAKIEHGAQDERPLYRHRWFVEYSPNQLQGGTRTFPDGTLAYWTLSEPGGFRRMTFDSDAAAALTVGTGLDLVSDMAKIAPGQAEIDDALLTWTPGPHVGGQIMFDRGALIDPAHDTRSAWVFPPTLRLKLRPGIHHVVELSHKIHFRLQNVNHFVIKVRKTRDEAPQTLALHSDSAEPVVVSICNLCDINPMRWPTKAPRRVDDDFRWYYEMSKNKGNLPLELQDLELPVPHPFGAPGGVGQNCLGTQYAPNDFTID